MAALVDTNVLVYCFDRRDPRKRRIAMELVDRGVEERSIRVAYQAIIEFYAVVTREIRGTGRILDNVSATRATEEWLAVFDVLYPTDKIIRAAMGATAVYQLPWYDALMWAYAEVNGLTEIISEDFQHGRLYGRVRIINPFQ